MEAPPVVSDESPDLGQINRGTAARAARANPNSPDGRSTFYDLRRGLKKKLTSPGQAAELPTACGPFTLSCATNWKYSENGIRSNTCVVSVRSKGHANT
ncbi:hypothetical protein J6590_025703 [Homalodisca vitripennis]|nr:hypothetical protein J6590_025703 [Homalodisca vitripennis]